MNLYGEGVLERIAPHLQGFYRDFAWFLPLIRWG